MAQILVVDDQSTSRLLLQELVSAVEAGIHVEAFADPADALAWVERNPVDLVFSDYSMPGMNGIEFIKLFRVGHPDTPVVMVTAVEDREIRYQALEAGATDFLTKPIDHIECRARCRNLLTLAHQQKLIRNRALHLETQVHQATLDILLREKETLLRLGRAGEYRDEETGLHVVRMARMAGIIASRLGLSTEECETIVASAPMHDIGKIGIPDEILNKPGQLDAHEREIMMTHTRIGYEILRDSPSRFIQLGAIIAQFHHERFDGSGYPNGLVGQAIPLAARIVAVADVFDALMTKRPYKEPWPLEKALDYMANQRERHFDPQCVDAFFQQLEEIQRVRREFADVPLVSVSM